MALPADMGLEELPVSSGALLDGGAGLNAAGVDVLLLPVGELLADRDEHLQAPAQALVVPCNVGVLLVLLPQAGRLLLGDPLLLRAVDHP
eukprot:9302070-Lingulodinium_polyedra.AAC.1